MSENTSKNFTLSQIFGNTNDVLTEVSMRLLDLEKLALGVHCQAGRLDNSHLALQDVDTILQLIADLCEMFTHLEKDCLNHTELLFDPSALPFKLEITRRHFGCMNSYGGLGDSTNSGEVQLL